MKNLTFEATNTSLAEGILLDIFKFMRFIPSILGLVDEVTDFYYYFTEDFENGMIKDLCLFFL